MRGKINVRKVSKGDLQFLVPRLGSQPHDRLGAVEGLKPSLIWSYKRTTIDIPVVVDKGARKKKARGV